MKRIVVCSDGTTNDPGANTNVSKVVKVLASAAGGDTNQVVFYDPGVGSGRRLWNRFSGGVVGHGLDKNVKDCYGFLVDNYVPGDELFFFGFSRGAFTARSLAGLLRCCGILRVQDRERLNDAYDIYRQKHDRGADKPAAVEFREAYSHEQGRAPIRFLGVWDTVGSLGVPGVHPLGWWSRRKHSFHDVTLSSSVETARQALAIDERRKPFKPQIWRAPIDKLEAKDQKAREAGKDESGWVKQVWFAGTHSQIGGGMTRARFAFQWMCAEAIEAGLELDEAALGRYKPDEAARIEKSPKLPYRLFGPFDRPIDGGPGAGFVTKEEVDASARRRWNDVGDYRPKTLRAYCEREGLLDADGRYGEGAWEPANASEGGD